MQICPERCFYVSGSSSFLVLQKTNTASNLLVLKYRVGGQLRNGALPVRTKHGGCSLLPENLQSTAQVP